MNLNKASVQTLVVDSGAIIRGEYLANKADVFLTVPGVVQEIRDEKSRELLASLPFKLEILQPSLEAVSKIIEVAKNSGDYNSLSKTDISVLALTYMLSTSAVESSIGSPAKPDIPTWNSKLVSVPIQKSAPVSTWTKLFKPEEAPILVERTYFSEVGESEAAGVDFIEDEPESSSFLTDEASENHFKDNPELEISTLPEEKVEFVQDEKDFPFLTKPNSEKVEELTETEKEKLMKKFESLEFKNSSSKEPAFESLELDSAVQESNIPTKSNVSRFINPRFVSSIEKTKGDVDDFDGEWVSERNLENHLNMEQVNVTGNSLEKLKVACVTTDFAMQNVLLLLGLGLISLEGRRILQVKKHVLKCDACFEITKELERLFCKNCGQPCLKKLFYTLKENGELEYHYKKNRVVSTRGTKYSIPMKNSLRDRQNQKNGKDKFHRNRLLLREDQLFSGYWGEKLRKKSNIKSMFDETLYEDINLNGNTKLSTRIGEEIKVGYGKFNPNSQKGRERRGKKKAA